MEPSSDRNDPDACGSCAVANGAAGTDYAQRPETTTYKTGGISPRCHYRNHTALKATIFKVTLNMADMDRHYYADHQMTLTRHPSENDERMMVRLSVSLWWDKNSAKLARFKNLSCVNLDPESTEQLAGRAQRAMNFQVTIQDGEVTVSIEHGLVALTPRPIADAVS